MICDRMDEKSQSQRLARQFGAIFGSSGTVEDNTLTLSSPFAIFEPNI